MVVVDLAVSAGVVLVVATVVDLVSSSAVLKASIIIMAMSIATNIFFMLTSFLLRYLNVSAFHNHYQ